MAKGTGIGKAIASLVLLCALMLPTAVQFSHIFNGHEQIHCNEQSVHIHEYVADCQICDFHLASYNYEIAEYPDLLPPAIPAEIENEISSLRLHYFHITNTQLRAPPHFLS